MVEFADDAGALGRVEESVFDLEFKETAFFFEDEDGFEAFGEGVCEGCGDRPGERVLGDADAEGVESSVIEREVAEGLDEVVIDLSGGGDSEAGVRARAMDTVDGIEVVEGAYGVHAVDVGFDFETIGDGGDEHAAGYFTIPRGGMVCVAVEGDVDGCAAVANVGDELEGGPRTGVAGEGDGVEAEVEDLLGRAGLEDGDTDVEEAEVGVVRNGGGFAGVVVAGEDEGSGEAGGSGEIGVAECVAGAVDAGAFAVPDADDAIDAGGSGGGEDLGAKDGGGGEIFVDGGDEVDVEIGEEFARAGEGDVVAAEGGAFVAGDKCAGAKGGAAVEAHLVHGEADERLDSGEVMVAGFGGEPVGELHWLMVSRRGWAHAFWATDGHKFRQMPN